MSIIVQKFGGSSLSDIDKIRKIALMTAAVKRQGHDVAVVVSAMGKTTSELIEMARTISPNPPKREMDMLLSTGERITMALLCVALHEIGIDAVSLTGSQAGIITNDRHNAARVIEVRPFRVQDELALGRVVVIGGFQGVSYKRDVTTLGRGGSDTSAVALAAALNAERCEIYSDIDGVYSADPSIIAEARHLPEISYQQMQEMSMAGAKVLNAEAVQFAKENNIALYARSTFVQGRETIVRKLSPGLASGVKAVVHEKEVVRIVLSVSHEEFHWLINYLNEKSIQIRELSYINYNSPDRLNTLSFVLSLLNIYGWQEFKAELSVKFQGREFYDFSLGAVSLIGDGLSEDSSVLNRTLVFLLENQICVQGITTTSFRISLLVSKEDVERCTRLCHNTWIS